MMCDDLFAMLIEGHVSIDIGQRFALEDAGRAQDALARRQTTGSTILVP